MAAVASTKFTSTGDSESESCRHTTTIDILSDDILLDIFDLYRKNLADSTYNIKDQALVYVCRRWRQIIFESPRRLGLRVRCTYGTLVKKDILICQWPNIPIAIDYCSPSIDTSPDDEENIIIALEHSDRVGHLGLHLTDLLLGKLATSMQKPFPALTHLTIISESIGEHTLVLPADFLGGSAPCLQEITLSSISFPALPTLLSSARDLVTLNLCEMPPTDYFSPEVLVAYLAALPRLETFDIRFQSTTPHPDQAQLHPTTRTILPALTDFQLDAAGKYLEDFTARIDCPRLNSFYLVYFVQLVNFQATQLVKFFERLVGPATSPFKEAKVRLDAPGVFLHTYRPNDHPGWDWHLARTIISSQTIDWQAFPLTRMLRHFSPILSSILYLRLTANYILIFPFGEPDVFDWLRLLQQFSTVRALCVSQPLAGRIGNSLKSFTGEMVAEALSSLDLLYLEKGPASCLEEFTAARQLSGRPVTVVDTVTEFDDRLECYLENKGKENTHDRSVP